MFWSALVLVSIGLACVIGVGWGGRDERFAVGAFITATIATRLTTQNQYGHPEMGVLFIDTILLIGLLVLALRSDRFWPMWAAAFQLVGTTIHLASMTESGDFAKAYANALVFWTYPVLFALIIGTWREMRYHRN